MTTGNGLATPAHAPRWAPAAFVLVAAVAVCSWAFAWYGSEAYPSLTQPAFTDIPGETVEFKTLTYQVRYADGSTELVSAEDLFPRSAGMLTAISQRLTKELVDDPETRAWLDDRVQRLDLDEDPVSLAVEVRESGPDPVEVWTIPLGAS